MKKVSKKVAKKIVNKDVMAKTIPFGITEKLLKKLEKIRKQNKLKSYSATVRFVLEKF